MRDHYKFFFSRNTCQSKFKSS